MKITYAKKEELNTLNNIDVFISKNQLQQAIKQKRGGLRLFFYADKKWLNFPFPSAIMAPIN